MIQPDPYKPESKGDKKMATYFDGDTLQPTLIMQLVTPAPKLGTLLLELHMLYFITLLGYKKIIYITLCTNIFAQYLNGISHF
jgi:hypothetical protein